MSYNGVKLHQMLSFSKLFTSAHSSSKRVFMPGCSLSAYSPDIVMKVYEYLNEKLPNTGMILKCCAAPSKLIGEKKIFEKYYSYLQEELDSMNIEEVITACQSCYKTIEEKSSHINIKSLWVLLDEIGIPDNVRNLYKNIDITFAIHDSCPTRKESNIHNSIRNIANNMGLKIEEFDNCREKTSCCGAKSMLTTSKDIAINQMKKRVKEVNSEYVLTYCQSCSESIILGGKYSIHILDLIFDEELHKNLEFKINKRSLSEKWINRFKCKKMVDDLNVK